jgi:hypothetical protein
VPAGAMVSVTDIVAIASLRGTCILETSTILARVP